MQTVNCSLNILGRSNLWIHTYHLKNMLPQSYCKVNRLYTIYSVYKLVPQLYVVLLSGGGGVGTNLVGACSIAKTAWLNCANVRSRQGNFDRQN